MSFFWALVSLALIVWWIGVAHGRTWASIDAVINQSINSKNSTMLSSASRTLRTNNERGLMTMQMK